MRVLNCAAAAANNTKRADGTARHPPARLDRCPHPLLLAFRRPQPSPKSGPECCDHDRSDPIPGCDRDRKFDGTAGGFEPAMREIDQVLTDRLDGSKIATCGISATPRVISASARPPSQAALQGDM